MPLQVVERFIESPVGGAIAQARAGDAMAQRVLFERNKQRLADQIYRMTGDLSSVDDLVQEVFISAFRALPEFRGEASLETWLYRIAINKVRTHWERSRRRQRRERQALCHAVEDPATPADGAERQEHLDHLYRALAELPMILREAFVARAIEGLSLAEASAVLEVPISTLSYRTRRAEELLVVELGLDAQKR